MYLIKLLASLIFAYLVGSINFAILISGWARGIDIREAGNKNPGTSNVGRVMGRGWAALVFLGDLAKGIVPLILARNFLFPEENYADYFALFLTGIAGIAGHCWPVYHQFTGGGGLATSIGIYMFFIPVEFFVTLFIAFLAVRLLFWKKEFSVGQLVPMFFVPLAPLMVLLSNQFRAIPLWGSYSIGGHPWYIITGVTVLSFCIVMINFRIVMGRFSKTTSE